MGTNYYLHENVCEHCGRPEEILHIGKSSLGWCFSLHVMPERGINDLEDWIKLFNSPGTRLRDEYDEKVEVDDMIERITKRSRRVHIGDDQDQMILDNQAVLGPNGLWRQKIGKRCVGHGAGTWDLIPGEFS